MIEPSVVGHGQRLAVGGIRQRHQIGPGVQDAAAGTSPPWATSQRRTSPSLPAEASVLPSGENATACTVSAWPSQDLRCAARWRRPRAGRCHRSWRTPGAGRRGRKPRRGPGRCGPRGSRAAGPVAASQIRTLLRLRQVARSDRAAVGRKGQRGDRAVSPLPGPDQPAGRRVPELDGRVGLGVVAASRQDAAIGRKGHRPRLVLVAGRLTVCVGVPARPAAIAGRPTRLEISSDRPSGANIRFPGSSPRPGNVASSAVRSPVSQIETGEGSPSSAPLDKRGREPGAVG